MAGDEFSSSVNLIANACKYDISSIVKLTPAQKQYYCKRMPEVTNLRLCCIESRGVIEHARLALLHKSAETLAA